MACSYLVHIFDFFLFKHCVCVPACAYGLRRCHNVDLAILKLALNQDDFKLTDLLASAFQMLDYKCALPLPDEKISLHTLLFILFPQVSGTNKQKTIFISFCYEKFQTYKR